MSNQGRGGDRVARGDNQKNDKPYSRPQGKSRRILPVKLEGVMFGGLEPIPTNARLDPPPRVCFNCWQRGHSRRYCPRPETTRICNNCGRRGEDLATCPRCKYAHLRYIKMGKSNGANNDDLTTSHHNKSNVTNEDVIRNLMLENERTRRIIEEQRDRVRELQERQRNIRYESGNQERVINPLYYERIHNKNRFEEDDLNDDYQSAGALDDQYDHGRRSVSPAGSSRKGDPVHEILELAKSISHLSPETQEIIMRQVVAERQQSKLRISKQEHSDNDGGDANGEDPDPWA